MSAPKVDKNVQTLIFILLFLNFGACQLISCKSNDTCHSSLNSSYECDLEIGLCRHSNLFENPNSFDLLGLFVILLFNFISFVMGVTANGVSLPILVLVFNFRVKNSLSALKMGNIFASFFNLLFILGIRHPQNSYELAADFELILFLVPLMTFGSMIGFLVFNWIPSAFSYILILILMTILTFRNFYKLFPQESTQMLSIHFISEEESLISDSQNDCSVYNPYVLKKNPAFQIKSYSKSKFNRFLYKDKMNSSISGESMLYDYGRDRFQVRNISRTDKTDVEGESLIFQIAPSVCKILGRKKIEIFLTICCFVCLVIGNIIKNQYVSVSNCSFFGICMFLLSGLPLIFIAHFAFKKLELRESEVRQIDPQIIGTFCLIGGFISSVAVSGSLIVSCSLLVLGLDPLVVKCTIGVVLFGLTINNLVQFSLSRYADWPNALLLGALSFLACFLANISIKFMISKFPISKTNFLICLSSFVMTLTLCFAVPLSFFFEYVTSNSIFQFGSFC